MNTWIIGKYVKHELCVQAWTLQYGLSTNWRVGFYLISVIAV